MQRNSVLAKGSGPRSPKRRFGAVAAVAVTALLATVLAWAPGASAVAKGSHNGRIVDDDSARRTAHVLNGYVRTIAEVGNLVVVGGNFTSVRSWDDETPIARTHMMAFDRATGDVTSFNPQINGEVFSVEPTGDGSTVWVAGGFSSVNGETVRSLTKIDVNTGQRVTSFDPPAFDGRVHDMALRNGQLYLMGRFLNVGGAPQTLVAAVDPVTGASNPDVSIDFAEPRRDGALSILSGDVSPDGTRMIAIGNFTEIDGQERYQIGMLDLTTSPISLADWSTYEYGDGCSRSFQSYMRDVEFSPDGSYFAVATTGAYNTTYLCDTLARWDTDRTGSEIQPEWINWTGGDTLTAVAVTDTAVYAGGHQRRMNNPYAGDRVGAGSVSRIGLSAHDTRSGATLSWDPGRTRGYGVYGFLTTDEGLWIGSDTDRISDWEYRGRLAFMPLESGWDMPTDFAGELPGQVVSLGLERGGSGSALDRTASRTLEVGGNAGAESVSAGTEDWSSVTGAFMIDGKLFTTWTDDQFRVQDFDGSSFGPSEIVPLELEGSGSLNRFATQDIDDITSMTYDPVMGRMYFTKSGSSQLHYRSFSSESRIVGAERISSGFNAGGVSWSGVRTMFIANGKLFTGDSSGNLTQHDWDAAAGLPVAGTGTVVSGPAAGDGQDWRAKDAFVNATEGWEPPNADPTAAFEASCTVASCDFDGTGSTDSDGTIVSWSWDFGDGTAPGVGSNASHVYAASGTYTVTLTVTDDRGATATVSHDVEIDIPNTPPTALFNRSCEGLECTFDGSSSFDPDGEVVAWDWDFGDGNTGNGETAAHTYAEAGTFEVQLTVTDDEGATRSASTQVTVVDPNQTVSVEHVASAGSEANTIAPAVDVPAEVQPNDLMVLIGTFNRTDTNVTGPAGWDLLEGASDGTARTQTFTWTRRVQPGDAGSTVSLSGTQWSKTTLSLMAYRNVAGVSDHAVAFDTTSTDQSTSPEVSAIAPGSALVSYWADRASGNGGWTVPGSVAERVALAGSGGGNVASVAGDSLSLAPGTVGGLTATSDRVTRRTAMWSIVLQPATTQNLAPVAAFEWSCDGLECDFDGSASVDHDGTITAWDWDLGNGSTANTETVNHTFPAAGTHAVSLTVTDDEGATNTVSAQVTVSEPVPSQIAFRAAAGSDANTIAPNVDVPAEVAEGDFMVLIGTFNRSDANVTGPAGWDLLTSGIDPATTMQTHVWTRTATAADAGTTVTLGNDQWTKTSLELLAYSGVAGVAEHQLVFDSSSGTDRTTPTVTNHTPGSTLVSYWADRTGGTTSWAVPATAQVRVQTAGAGGGHITAAAADTGSLGTGPVGGLVASADSSGRRAVTGSFVLEPSA